MLGIKWRLGLGAGFNNTQIYIVTSWYIMNFIITVKSIYWIEEEFPLTYRSGSIVVTPHPSIINPRRNYVARLWTMTESAFFALRGWSEATCV